MEGLILQSGFEGTRSTLVLDGQVTSTFTFAEGTDADDAVTQYVCVPLSDGSILLVELSYYVAAEETAGQALQEMLRSITFSTQGKRPQSNSSVEYAQCPDAANGLKRERFRNHLCPAREAAEANDAGSTEYVQCDICGQWFRAAMSFVNHLFASPIPMKITSMMKFPSLEIIPRHDRPGKKQPNKKSPPCAVIFRQGVTVPVLCQYALKLRSTR